MIVDVINRIRIEFEEPLKTDVRHEDITLINHFISFNRADTVQLTTH